MHWHDLWQAAKSAGKPIAKHIVQNWGSPSVTAGTTSRRRDCHFADAPSAAILKRLLKGEGGAAE